MQTCADLFASSFSSIPRALRQLWFGDDVYEAKRSILEFVFMPSGGVAALMEPVMARPPRYCAEPLACAYRLHNRHATPRCDCTTHASSAVHSADWAIVVRPGSSMHAWVRRR